MLMLYGVILLYAHGCPLQSWPVCCPCVAISAIDVQAPRFPILPKPPLQPCASVAASDSSHHCLGGATTTDLVTAGSSMAGLASMGLSIGTRGTDSVVAVGAAGDRADGGSALARSCRKEASARSVRPSMESGKLSLVQASQMPSWVCRRCVATSSSASEGSGSLVGSGLHLNRKNQGCPLAQGQTL